MNIFNGVGFSRLIKTVIPGILLVVALLGYLDLVALQFRGQTFILPLLQSDFSIMAAIVLVLSVPVGILGNMLVFAWGTDTLIRRPFANDHAELLTIESRVLDEARLLKVPPEILRDGDPSSQLDVEYLLAHEVPLEKLTYMQEGYWYYLEFQMNTALAVLASAPLGVAVTWRFSRWLGVDVAFAWAAAGAVLLLSIALIWLLVGAAQINYARHMRKRLSLLVAALHHARNGAPGGEVTVRLTAEGPEALPFRRLLTALRGALRRGSTPSVGSD